VLDDRITVTVPAIRGTLVRLGTDAGPDAAVRRGELDLLDPAPGRGGHRGRVRRVTAGVRAVTRCRGGGAI
jgi:hypothetical protein